jgi:hypothetical protein
MWGMLYKVGTFPTPSPSLLLTIKPIPEAQKKPISDTLDTLEATLDNTIKTKNQLQSSLETLTKPLDTLQQLSSTLNGVLTGLDTAVTIIKLIPIPITPGTPASVLTGFSSTLDTLKGVIDKTKGPLGVIPPSVRQINQLIIPIVNKLNLLDPVFDSMIKLISFIRILLLFGPNATQQEIDSVLQETSTKITESLEATGPTSNNEENKRLNQELLDRLNPNSNNPLFYKGFKLTIEYDPNNKFSFASRRVKGFLADANAYASESSNSQEISSKSTTGVTLYNLDDDDGVNGADYSFSASPEVLIKEIEYKIDQYLLKGKYDPIGFPGDIDGQKIGYKGKIYQWGEASDEWSIIPDPTFQAIVIRSRTKKTHINLRRLEVYGSFINSLTNQLQNNTNILPIFADKTKTRFLNWPDKTNRGSWTRTDTGQRIYFARNIIDGPLTNKFNIHTGRSREGKNNALLIPLTRSFNLNGVSKVTLYNRVKADENISEGRINGFQIEFYKTENDVLNGRSPILVIPITGVKPKYDFTLQQVKDLQSL